MKQEKLESITYTYFKKNINALIKFVNETNKKIIITYRGIPSVVLEGVKNKTYEPFKNKTLR